MCVGRRRGPVEWKRNEVEGDSGMGRGDGGARRGGEEGECEK